MPDDGEIRAALLDLAIKRGRTKTFCPSDVARRFGPMWRDLMPRVRALSKEVGLVAMQSGVVVDA